MAAINFRVGTRPTGDGRNEIRVGNSAGRCLLENWVEERANIDRDPPIEREYNMNEMASFLRSGHQGLLTIDDKAKTENLTSVRAAYTLPNVDKTRHVGIRKELMEKAFVKAISEEMLQERNRQEAEERAKPMCSTFMQDYTRDFPKTKLENTKDHNYVNEQPVTFWSEHKDKVHGVTQVKTGDSAFRRNDAFSKPIGEFWDEPKPIELDRYPMM